MLIKYARSNICILVKTTYKLDRCWEKGFLVVEHGEGKKVSNELLTPARWAE